MWCVEASEFSDFVTFLRVRSTAEPAVFNKFWYIGAQGPWVLCHSAQKKNNTYLAWVATDELWVYPRLFTVPSLSSDPTKQVNRPPRRWSAYSHRQTTTNQPKIRSQLQHNNNNRTSKFKLFAYSLGRETSPPNNYQVARSSEQTNYLPLHNKIST